MSGGTRWDARARQLVPLAHRDTSADIPTFSFGDHPQLILSCGSKFPDKLKVRKRLHVWPLTFKLRADFVVETKELHLGCSCRDSVLDGRIRFNDQILEYRKRFPIGNGASFNLTAKCNHAGIFDSTKQMNPSAQFGFELGSGNAMWAGNVFDLRHKLRVSRHAGLEVCGSAQLPVPRAQYTVDSSQQNVALGEGPCRLHVAQMNLCLDL